MVLWNESGWDAARWDLGGSELASDWFQIAYDGDTEIAGILSIIEFDGDLYAGTSDGRVITSVNGTTWSLAYDSLEDEMHGLALFGGDLYAITGNNGRVLKTTDGSSWTLAYDSPQTDLFAIQEFSSYLYVGGDNGVIYRSSDGATWTLAYDSPQTTIHDFGDFNGSLFAATGTNGVIYSSADGTTWSLAYDSPQTGILSLASLDPSLDPYVDDTLFAGVDTSFLIYKTTDGTTWEVAYDGPDGAGGVNSMYATDAMIFAGSDTDGSLFKSDDGLTWFMSYDSPAGSINAMAPWSSNCNLYLGADEFVYSMDNLPQISLADTCPDITAPDGGETITVDTFTVQWSVEDDTNLVFDVEYSRNWSTNRDWETAVDDTGGDPGHTGAPLTGIPGDPNGNYLEADWNVLPIVDSTDMKIRIRARDTSASGCARIGSWNESEDIFELNNGPC